jgi:hypothetical protein
MRKFIFNGAVLGALFGAWSAIQTTRHGPRDWRLVLTWVSWALTLVLAIGSAVSDSREAEVSKK